MHMRMCMLVHVHAHEDVHGRCTCTHGPVHVTCAHMRVQCTACACTYTSHGAVTTEPRGDGLCSARGIQSPDACATVDRPPTPEDCRRGKGDRAEVHICTCTSFTCYTCPMPYARTYAHARTWAHVTHANAHVLTCACPHSCVCEENDGAERRLTVWRRTTALPLMTNVLAFILTWLTAAMNEALGIAFPLMTYLLTQVAHGSHERGAWDSHTKHQEERRTQAVRAYVHAHVHVHVHKATPSVKRSARTHALTS